MKRTRSKLARVTRRPRPASAATAAAPQLSGAARPPAEVPR